MDYTKSLSHNYQKDLFIMFISLTLLEMFQWYTFYNYTTLVINLLKLFIISVFTLIKKIIN